MNIHFFIFFLIFNLAKIDIFKNLLFLLRAIYKIQCKNDSKFVIMLNL